MQGGALLCGLGRTEEGGSAAQSAEIWSEEKSGQSQLSSSNASLARRSASCAAADDIAVGIAGAALEGKDPARIAVPGRKRPALDHLAAGYSKVNFSQGELTFKIASCLKIAAGRRGVRSLLSYGGRYVARTMSSEAELRRRAMESLLKSRRGASGGEREREGDSRERERESDARGSGRSESPGRLAPASERGGEREGEKSIERGVAATGGTPSSESGRAEQKGGEAGDIDPGQGKGDGKGLQAHPPVRQEKDVRMKRMCRVFLPLHPHHDHHQPTRNELAVLGA